MGFKIIALALPLAAIALSASTGTAHAAQERNLGGPDQIKNVATGECQATGLEKNNVYDEQCKGGNPYQQWTYDATTRQIKNVATSQCQATGLEKNNVYNEQCKGGNPYQQWTSATFSASAPSGGTTPPAGGTYEGTGSKPGSTVVVVGPDGTTLCKTTAKCNGSWTCVPDAPKPSVY